MRLIAVVWWATVMALMPLGLAARSTDNDVEVQLRQCRESQSIDVVKDCLIKLIKLNEVRDELMCRTKVLAGECAKEPAEKMQICLRLIAAGGEEAAAEADKLKTARSVWKWVCSTSKMTDERDCLVSADLPNGGSLTYVVGEYIFGITRDRTLFRSARFRIDKGEVMNFTGCVGATCLTRLHNDHPLLNKLRSGSTVLIDYQTSNGSGGPFEIPLAGFSEAYEKAVADRSK